MYRNDVREGEGVLQLASGYKYEGEFKNGVYHGTGTERYANGSIYSGEFESGQRSGYGVFKSHEHMILVNAPVRSSSICSENAYMYEGEWKMNQRNGKGKFHFSNKGNLTLFVVIYIFFACILIMINLSFARSV